MKNKIKLFISIIKKVIKDMTMEKDVEKGGDLKYSQHRIFLFICLSCFLFVNLFMFLHSGSTKITTFEEVSKNLWYAVILFSGVSAYKHASSQIVNYKNNVS